MPKIVFVLSLFCMLFVQPSYAACIKSNSQFIPVNQYYKKVKSSTGVKLHKTLNNIIKGHKSFKYTPCVWTILKESDVDPKNRNNIIGFYSRRSIKKSRQVSGGGNRNDWNREHVWAKSHGFRSRKQHAHTDLHHLRAADVSVNAARGNRDFANGGVADSECRQCLLAPLPNRKTVNDRANDGTWESPNLVKGDTARMMFYMAVRYDGRDKSRTPDLVLVDRLTKVGDTKFGKLCTLLNWHQQDPVSNEERTRNEIIYQWQGNRNPFIDHPEYAVSIWGAQCGLK